MVEGGGDFTTYEESSFVTILVTRLELLGRIEVESLSNCWLTISGDPILRYRLSRSPAGVSERWTAVLLTDDDALILN